VQLARVDAFIPAVQSVMCVIDLLTAVLLLAQYSIQPTRGILAVAGGYVFSGLFAFIQALTYPGAYSPTGLIGDINSAPWLFVFWHTTFPLALIVYTLSKDEGKEVDLSRRSIGAGIVGTIAFVLAATAALTWLAVDGTRYLPAMYLNTLQQTPFAEQINVFLWAINLTAFVLLFIRRRTVLDIWLTVVLFAWWPTFFVGIFYTVFRFSAGWYFGRLAALVASSTLLVVLLAESAALYGRLASALLLVRRERADRLTNVQAATAAMAHELKQPLAAIGAYRQAALLWLKKNPPDLAQIGNCVTEIGEANRRADEIITSIRGLFKKTPLQRSRVVPEQLVRQALDLVQHDLQMNQVSVTADFTGDLPAIEADPVQLQQVILNLVGNAIDAMAKNDPERRRLRVAARRGEHAEVLLLVEDTGHGLGATDRDRVFDPFFTTKPTGMGLGLAISRTILEEHGGSLRVVRTDAQGSTFEIALPVAATHDGNRPAKVVSPLGEPVT